MEEVMTLAGLTVALGIASFILAIAAAVLAIYSSLWQWRIYKDAQATQRDANGLLAQVSEKVDLVASHTSRQVDHAIDVIAAQASRTQDFVAEYKPASEAVASSSAAAPFADSLEWVLLDSAYKEIASLAQDYLGAYSGNGEPNLGDAVMVLVNGMTGQGETIDQGATASLPRDLLDLEASWKRGVVGETLTQ
jgi:hypothetical protein